MQFGTGFKKTIPKRYRKEVKGFQNLSSTKHCLRLVQKVYGYGLQQMQKSKEILALSISKERNTFVTERFMSDLAKAHGRYLVSTDGRTSYSMTCRFLKLKHHIHSHLAKSLIERTVQHIKDRTESCDEYFPCKLKNCKLKHVRNWLNLSVDS